MSSAESVLGWVPELQVSSVRSSYVGMAGAFGYGADTHEVSLAVAELSLLPVCRAAPDDAVTVTNGLSCQHLVAGGAGRPALNLASILAAGLQTGNGDRHGT